MGIENENGGGSVSLSPFFITTTQDEFIWVADTTWEDTIIKIEIT